MASRLLAITSRRIRQTPFSGRVQAAGMKVYSVYNHMLLPVMFESLEADCAHLKRHVQIWDVACERQVEVRGRDAARLLQMLTPRDLSRLTVGQCYYTPMVDDTGGMLNDPVTLKLDDQWFWISIADSDLLLWVKGLACGLGLDVEVGEPDVSPLAVQGPKADDLMARVFGERVRSIRFFRFERLDFAGRSLVVARSGYSKQGGFEIYLEGRDLGPRLWDELMAAGADLEVRAGGPNGIERIEGGLLSYGSDMTRENNPYECGLGRLCRPEVVTDCIGREALLRIAETGPARQIRGLRIAGEPLPFCLESWAVVAEGEVVGQVNSAVWSPDLASNIAIGMVCRSHWESGTPVVVETDHGGRDAIVCTLPFIQQVAPGSGSPAADRARAGAV
jgi:dimethylsulfoniopropionate demethylase